MKAAIYVCGGLGNQLFQFACLLAYCRKHQFQPIFDRAYHGELHTRDLFWDQFPALQEKIPEGTLGPCTTYQEDDSIYQEIPKFEGNVLLRGYFNCEKYFLPIRDEIKALFRACIPPPSLSSHSLRSPRGNCVAVHVRRGDYLKYQHVFHLLRREYYETCLSHLPDREVCIVSEDEDWCKQNLKGEIVHGSILEDFQFLMSCQNVVLANSTFSWWAAYLNPYAERVFMPLEWFVRPQYYKYSVKGWFILSHSETFIYQFLISKIRNKNIGEFKQVMDNLHPSYFQHRNINHLKIYGLDNYRFAKEIQARIQEEGTPIDGVLRANLCKILARDAATVVNFKETPCYIIAGEDRKAEMRKRFAEKGITPIFVDAVIASEKAEGCTRAHIKALRKAVGENRFPCMIFEDDVAFTLDYTEEIEVPLADAVYLGLSTYGVGGWNKQGIKHLDIQRDVETNVKFLRIRNMLAAHAILYMNRRYAEKVLRYVEGCLHLKFICDIGTARAQEESNVLCVESPFFVQDIHLAKNRAQAQNNRETFVSFKKSKLPPLDASLLI